MSNFSEQASILQSLIRKQKCRMNNTELKKRITFLLCDDNANYYKKELEKLSIIFNICEGLLISQKYQRTLYYLCLIQKKIDRLYKRVNQDFGVIQKKM